MTQTKVASDKVDLRRGVDHIGVSASFVVHDGQGRVLLQKRGTKARDEQGKWDVGGGAIEFGESIDEAVRREIKEELCVDPLDVEFCASTIRTACWMTAHPPTGLRLCILSK